MKLVSFNYTEGDVVENKSDFKSNDKVFRKIMAMEVDKTFTRNDKYAKILKSFLSNPVKNLKIPEFK